MTEKVSVEIDKNVYYSQKEIAQILSVTDVTIMNYIRAGELRAYKIGKNVVRVKGSDFLDFLDSSLVVPDNGLAGCS